MTPFGHKEVVILDKDDENFILIDDDNNPELEIIDCLPPYSRASPESSLNEVFPQSSFAASTSHSRTKSVGKRPIGSFPSNRTGSHTNSTFRVPNWGLKSSESVSSSRNSIATPHLHRLESLGDTRFFATCPSLRSGLDPFDGSVLEPIHLDDQNVLSEKGQRAVSRACYWRSKRNSISSSSFSRQHRPSNRDFTILDDADLTDPFSVEERSPAFQQSLEQARKSLKQAELIDLDSLEDVTEDGIEILRIEDVYEEEQVRKRGRRKSSKAVRFERRNPTVVGSWQRLDSALCLKDVTLKANKSVQLKDDSFIRIKDILRNDVTQEIRLRGHRLQRARDLNGLLEKKLNELVLFLEVDLDDPREPLEQSTVEVALEEFARIRSVRFTNQKFPLCRNVVLAEFRDKEHAALDGGLTVRWKYTCTYSSAADRYHNVFKERSLERLRGDECTPGFDISDEDRRTQWRGETILGGAYRPGTDPEDVIVVPESPEMIPISIPSTPDPDDVVYVPHPWMEVSKPDDNDAQTCVLVEDGSVSRVEKRKYTAIDLDLPDMPSKKVRCEANDQIEEAGEAVENMTLEAVDEESVVVNLPHETPVNPSSAPATVNLCSDLPHTIDLISAEPSQNLEPEATQTTSQEPKPPITKTPGQTYSYGDSFCGGGGSSRGATMAGLRLKWGFDFNKHACLTWRANFPHARMYQLPSHEFVSLAQSSDNPDMMKVDILHLSPPCQFFSPAHTVEGVDDEMNVASLFAVQSVIGVSKPRIVTLEQTFGIACSRFRFYFNALIQMFTTHDFSVRWAIVPLAQWGLPQRRMRLIIIASCPGEPLPRMPLPTHSTTGSGPPLNLLPHVSANSILSSIPPNAPDHDIESVTWPPNRHQPPWDGTKILPRAMTTSGGQNYHPSGMRDLTLREYACLQGFPATHVFGGNYVKKQIGNAVPPCVAKVLFGSIRGDLERVDGVEGVEVIE